MADPADGIVERYAEHLAKKAGSAVVTLAVAGAVAGAVLGAIPGLLSHSVISPGTNYFAVLLGAIAGGFAGRSLGEKRAVGLRLQAQMALHQARLERRLPPAAAPAPAPAAPVAPVLPPAPQVPPLVSPAPVVVAAPPTPPPPAPPAASAPAAMPPATVSVVPGLRAAAPPVVGSGSEQQPRPAEQGPKLPPLTAPASSDR